jgi:hypothetical protein
MNFNSQWSDKGFKFTSIAVLALGAISVYGIYCFNTVSQVKINGPHYRSIALGQELVADVLPPGGYLVETHLVAFEMMDADGERLVELTHKAARLKAQFLERSAYWNNALSDELLKRILIGEAVPSGKAFLETMEDGYIPALLGGDKTRARALLHGTMRQQFRMHREGVEAVVRLAMVRNRQNENDVARTVYERTLGQVIMGFSLVVFLAVGIFRMVLKCEAQLKRKLYGMLTGETPLSPDLQEKVMWN